MATENDNARKSITVSFDSSPILISMNNVNVCSSDRSWENATADSYTTRRWTHE